MSDEPEFLTSLREEIRNRFKTRDVVHNLKHNERVLRNALRILEFEGGNREVVAAAALVHDIHRFQGEGYIPPEKCLSAIEEILEGSELGEGEIRDVIACVKIHDDYSFAGENRATTKEQKILQDADNLDAMGAIGIARAFAFGGKNDEDLWDGEESLGSDYDPSDISGSVIKHFHDKLLRLKENMNTEKGRELAEERHDFMEEFVDRFKKEWKGDK